MNGQHSWVLSANSSDFSIYNLPYGVFRDSGEVSIGVAIGDYILNLAALGALGFFEGIIQNPAVFSQSSLNNFIALGPAVWARTRTHLQNLLLAGNESLSAVRDQVLIKREGTELLLPVTIGDYTDFYSSIEHATNVGRLFRPDNPLLPNYRHIPIGYHGRASSIVVSGTDIIRPRGQVLPTGSDTPIFTLSNALDFELELAFVVGKESEMGTPIPISDAESAIFGVALFNDWTARDIQKWEYVPLGPFLGKSFASSLSPWIVPFAALEPFRVAGPSQEPPPLPYLAISGNHHFDIDLSVTLATSSEDSATVCRTNARTLYWSMAQQLAHHTSNGCNVRVGDLMASGTISGSKTGSFGSLLEASAGGKNPIEIASGINRSFLEDGDSVIMTARAERDGVRVGFGEVIGKIVSSNL
jgi:fumarylacetoacetase